MLGFDSGATSVMLLAASEQVKGLFQRVFAFNGSPASAYDTPQASRALAKNLLKETQTSTMRELLALDTEALKNAAQKLWQNMCAPTCDGVMIPTDVYQAYRDGAASGVDAFAWKAFPKALIVSDGKLLCDTIEDRITAIEGLLDFVVS